MYMAQLSLPQGLFDLAHVVCLCTGHLTAADSLDYLLLTVIAFHDTASF